MIHAFLGRGGYRAGEYYDVAALGFLHAVQRYLTQPRLRRYAFSTIAWQSMARSVAAECRTEECRRQAEQKYLETVQVRPLSLDTGVEYHLLLRDLMAGASEEQHRLALLRLRGCTLKEAARLQNVGVKCARRLLEDLRRDHLLLNSEIERGFNFNEY